jgi:hypothetical protein
MKNKKPKPRTGKRGGQAGNKNALKHGFWANWKNTQRSKGDLERLIAYLEHVIENLSEMLDPLLAKNALSQTEQEKMLALINILMLVVDRYVNAVKILAYMTGDMSELEKQIEEGLFLTRQSKGILEYLDSPTPNLNHPPGP